MHNDVDKRLIYKHYDDVGAVITNIIMDWPPLPFEWGVSILRLSHIQTHQLPGIEYQVINILFFSA